MDSCAEAARARDEFGQLQISFSPSGFLYLIPTLHVRTRTTGPHPLRARELTTPHPESLTTRLVPVEVDLKQQIFNVCSSLNNGPSPKGRLRQLCAMALNRCAIARCAGSPTASTVAGVKIVDSARVALS